MKIAIICCLHGNEKYGLDVVRELPYSLPFFIGNKKAMIEGKRFIDSDLNRCFPGKLNGNYEEKRACELVESLKDFDYVIDLHSSSNNCPLFGIITKPNIEKINLAKSLGLKKLVIMPKHIANGKALIDFVKCGISLEIGPHERSENVEEVTEKILNLIENKLTQESIDIFEVISVIKKEVEGEILIKNFEKVNHKDILIRGNTNQFAESDFIPILVNEESYGNILCLSVKQVNLKVIGEYYNHAKKRV